MDRSQLVRSRLGAAGFAWGEASRCEPASCCEPAALSCWQIAEWLVGGPPGTPQVEARRHQHTPQGSPCPVSTAELLKVALVFFVQATAARGRRQQQLDGKSDNGITTHSRGARNGRASSNS